MKKGFLILVLPLLAASYLHAQSKIETINLKGRDYTVSKDLPAEILGVYEYEDKVEPIVEIRKDGTGVFQPHM
ncbi:MAG: hypothetical protein DMF62_15275, partial [Acidobacteria bacterium]